MREEWRQSILASIRESSEAGVLLPEEEIFANVIRKRIESDEQIQEAATKAILDEIMCSNGEINVVSDSSCCRYYYSSLTMTQSYAHLLVLKRENSLQLMASIIREHSVKYPRPVPITVFQTPPFELSPDEISFCINKMVGMQDYEDIDQITTSIGNLFLYSKRYLDGDYAEMLAEWEDVGQSENP